jgi:hypothetical protein
MGTAYFRRLLPEAIVGWWGGSSWAAPGRSDLDRNGGEWDKAVVPTRRDERRVSPPAEIRQLLHRLA